ncbi:MAG: hypothetical protein R3B47_03020 [Bacteroidia bacterium]
MSIHSQDPKEGIDEKKVEAFVSKGLKALLIVTLVVLTGLAIWANI